MLGARGVTQIGIYGTLEVERGDSMTFVYCDNGVYVIEHEDQDGRHELKLSSLEARKLKNQLNALIAGF